MMSNSESMWGRVLTIVLISWGKHMVWHVYLNWPPRACVTCRIGLTQAMSISSTWVSTTRTWGCELGSMLFAREKRWPQCFAGQCNQQVVPCNRFDFIHGYDSLQIEHEYKGWRLSNLSANQRWAWSRRWLLKVWGVELEVGLDCGTSRQGLQRVIVICEYGCNYKVWDP